MHLNKKTKHLNWWCILYLKMGCTVILFLCSLFVPACVEQHAPLTHIEVNVEASLSQIGNSLTSSQRSKVRRRQNTPEMLLLCWCRPRLHFLSIENFPWSQSNMWNICRDEKIPTFFCSWNFFSGEPRAGFISSVIEAICRGNIYVPHRCTSPEFRTSARTIVGAPQWDAPDFVQAPTYSVPFWTVPKQRSGQTTIPSVNSGAKTVSWRPAKRLDSSPPSPQFHLKPCRNQLIVSFSLGRHP